MEYLMDHLAFTAILNGATGLGVYFALLIRDRVRARRRLLDRLTYVAFPPYYLRVVAANLRGEPKHD